MTGRGHRRKSGKFADYLLLYRPDLPIAVVEAKAEWKNPGDGMQQAMEYAEILQLKFAYATNGKGILEHDYTTGVLRPVDRFPSPDELWSRMRPVEGLTDPRDADDYLFPFNREIRRPDGTVKEPRYYQRIAIQRAIHGVLQGRPRILLTMATGTGKTFVAVQTVWKLWKTSRKGRILYLADRNILIDQPRNLEFSIFGDAVHKIQGEAKRGREIHFAIYQAIADREGRPGLYREYPPDYFDLIIVDECHRGSARDESNWRAILEYFRTATQIGMTATPLREDNRDTYAYFGDPVYTYTLRQGIEDGFLAPYQVRRIVPSLDATGWRPEKGQLDRFGREIPDDLYTTADFERKVSFLTRTEAVARHLTEYLKSTDRFAKTMVFCVDQDHAEEMRAALHRANEDLAREYPHYVARVVADEGSVGRGHLDKFCDPEERSPVILTTSQLLTTGVDAPTCKNIVLFKLIGSMTDFKQIIGRGSRIYEEQDKLWFTILDYTGATRLFADPAFDGFPERPPTEERIDERGDRIGEPSVIAEASAEEGESGFEAEAPALDLAADAPTEPRKLFVDGVVVRIVHEMVQVLDAEGRTLRTIRYTDYTADKVRDLYRTAEALRSKWAGPEGRVAVLEALAERGIDFEQLASVAKQPDADPFDLLVHLAWNMPLATRRDRAERVRREKKDFFAKFTPEARAVLEDLLEKYAQHGVTQLDDLKVLEVPPLSDRGTPVEIAGYFGGRERLVEAVAGLQDLLYAA